MGKYLNAAELLGRCETYVIAASTPVETVERYMESLGVGDSDPLLEE